MEGESPTVEMSVRSLRPDAAGWVDHAVSGLRALEHDGAIDGPRVDVWGR